jgi:hypothetical protein
MSSKLFAGGIFLLTWISFKIFLKYYKKSLTPKTSCVIIASQQKTSVHLIKKKVKIILKKFLTC